MKIKDLFVRKLDRNINGVVKADQLDLDYFNVVPEDFNEDWSAVINFLNTLRDKIKDLSRKRDPSIKLKHSWLRQKFNDMIENSFDKDRVNIHGHPIPPKYLSDFEKITVFK